MTRYTYNQQVNPPAPFVHVTVGTPDGTKQSLDLPAQLDTGAFKTVIPWAVVEQLGLPPYRSESVWGLDGKATELPTFLVQAVIRGQKPVTIEALSSRQEPFVLLGRDVLNHFRVLLDGPSLAFEIS